MKNIKKFLSILLAGISILGLSGCNLVSKTPEAIAKSVVAKVNGESITRGELDKDPTYLQQIAQLKANDPNYENEESNKDNIKSVKSQVLDNMITTRLILQEAKKLGINADDPKIAEEVQKSFDDIKKTFNNDETKFAAALKQAGYTEQSLKEGIKINSIEQKVYDKVTSDVKIDDAKAKEYYDANKFNYTQKTDTIKLAHILVKTEAEANKVIERLKKGENFGKLAKELSLDTGSKDKNGEYEVPYVNSGFDKTFMDAALALDEGKISKPVQTQYGFHVIKCIKKTEYPVKAFDTVKSNIKKTLEQSEKQTKFTNQISTWKKASKIETKKYEKNLM